MVRANSNELLESNRWLSFVESIAIGLQLELLIISQGKEQTKASKVCPICQAVYTPLGDNDLKTISANPNGELRLENGISVFVSPLRNGLLMLVRECPNSRAALNSSLVNRGQIAAKLLGSFQIALTEGVEGGQRAVELSTLQQLNHFVLSLFQGEGNALNSSFDLILSAVIILLDAEGSWLEFTDSDLPALLIKGNIDAVNGVRLKETISQSITVEIANHKLLGRLGVVAPSDVKQANGLLPLLAQECIIAIEVSHLFHLLNQQLNQVLGEVASAILLINKDHSITFANRQAEKLMQRQNIELLGSSITNWAGPWLKHLDLETNVPMRGEMELFPTDADPANPCWVDWQTAPLLEDSAIIGWLLLLDDRTDYYCWQEAARQAERFATTAMMVGALAHELRNPLSAAKGLLQLMGRKRDSEQNRNFTDLIIRELDRVTQLLNEFLLLGKPAKLESKPIDPSKFLQELLPLFRGEANGRDVEIILDLKPAVPPIAADLGQLTQVMLNLVRNAVQAIGSEGSITITVKDDNDLVNIDVIDNGPGLTLEAVKNLFRPFFTTKERGTGLGLAVVQAIVHNHGGKIRAMNKLGGGAVFSLSFPAAKKEIITAIDVLIVGSDSSFTYPVEQVLISAGYKVLKFANMEQAIKDANYINPSVVVVKISLTNEIIAEYCSKKPDTKILLLVPSLAEHTRAELASNIQKTGARSIVEFLEYPIALTRLVNIVRCLLA